MFLQPSIGKELQWAMFEPNDEPPRTLLRKTVEDFSTTQWRSGALAGNKADQAFFVRRDRTTMSGNDIDNGRLILDVGIAPLKPAEFIVFRIEFGRGSGGQRVAGCVLSPCRAAWRGSDSARGREGVTA